MKRNYKNPWNSKSIVCLVLFGVRLLTWGGGVVSSLKAVRIGNSLMIIGAPLLAQKVKNLPAMQETRV